MWVHVDKRALFSDPEVESMPDRLVTVATFWSSGEANLAKNRIEEAGLRVVITDDMTTGMDWLLTNAIGGIKLQVMEHDAEAALAALEVGEPATVDDREVERQPNEDEYGDASPEEDEPELAPSTPTRPVALARPELGDEVEVSSSRDETAERAYRAAVLGIVLFPIEIYAFWLLIQVFISDEPLAPANRWKVTVAAIINLPVMFCLCMIARFALSD